jgi:serine/threonine protein kinase
MHRDVKPANLLVFVAADGKVTVKIGDVGLARFAASAASHRPTQGAGTIFYMAPEVVDGRYDESADLFSFGVMMAQVAVEHVQAVPRPADSY